MNAEAYLPIEISRRCYMPPCLPPSRRGTTACGSGAGGQIRGFHSITFQITVVALQNHPVVASGLSAIDVLRCRLDLAPELSALTGKARDVTAVCDRAVLRGIVSRIDPMRTSVLMR
jgi:hypothetical protein